MLDVTDGYLAELEGGGRTLLLTSLPLKPMAQWTWLERFGGFEGLEERRTVSARLRGQSPWLHRLAANDGLQDSDLLRRHYLS